MAQSVPSAYSEDWLRRFVAATEQHLSGRLTEARAEYLKLVVEQPTHAHLLQLLGMLEKSMGQPEMAVHWLGLALQVAPDVGTLLQLADVLLEQQDVGRARQCLNGALALQPESAEVHFRLGLVCKEVDEPQAALAEFAQVLTREPQHIKALHEHNLLLFKLGQLEEAIAGFDRYLQLKPADASTHYNRGMACQSTKRLDEAVDAYRRALALNPAMDAAFNNLGTALAQLTDYQGALAAHEAGLQIAPDNANYHYNKALVLHELERFDEAAEGFSRALALRPDFVAAAFNRGNALREALRVPEAIASLDLALSLEPDNANFHWTKALAALLAGDYLSGWSHYERRWSRDGGEVPREFTVPQWTGRQGIRGKTLLIHGEQGLGDMLQFSRYAMNVIALGGKVVFGAPTVLHPLLNSMHPSIKCIISNAQHPDFDFHCPVMSLPYAFSTTVDTVPAPCPYFHADPLLQQAWATRLGPADRPRVGLVWFGNPKHLHDHRRSIPLAALQPVLDLPLDFHCLQQELRAQDEAVLEQYPHIHFHGPALNDFAQTAALIANLDLVVTVDTSVAHLAGALGKPVWILIHHVPDFRWLLARDDSPWYPSARLFRQVRRGVWTEAIDLLRDALDKRFALGGAAA